MCCGRIPLSFVSLMRKQLHVFIACANPANASNGKCKLKTNNQFCDKISFIKSKLEIRIFS